MLKINWREKLIAASIHLFFTAVVTGLAALLIFYVWFPDGMSALIGGAAMFLIMVGCDVVLGPMISLVVYSSAKPKRELIADYAVIGVLQLVALGYGVWSMAVSRPVFVAFDVRRIEVISAIELDDEELVQGVEPRFRNRSLWGPQPISMQRPTNDTERARLVFEELNGRGAYLSPKYYRDYDAALEEIRAAEQTLDTLLKGSGSYETIIRDAVKATGKQEADLRWLLAHHRFGFGVALIDAKTHRPLRFVAVNPIWVT